MLNLSAITAEVSFILTVAQRFPCPTAVSSRDHIFKRMTDSDDVIHCQCSIMNIVWQHVVSKVKPTSTVQYISVCRYGNNLNNIKKKNPKKFWRTKKKKVLREVPGSITGSLQKNSVKLCLFPNQSNSPHINSFSDGASSSPLRSTTAGWCSSSVITAHKRP